MTKRDTTTTKLIEWNENIGDAYVTTYSNSSAIMLQCDNGNGPDPDGPAFYLTSDQVSQLIQAIAQQANH